MKTIFAGALGAAAVFCAFNSQPAKANSPPLTVNISQCAGQHSTVTGFIGDLPGGAPGQMRQFLGIPYAAPPTGTKRWLPPAKAPCWAGDRSANLFSKQCPQGAGGSFQDEDCLYLNVFSKPTGLVSKQPVMVFIHGGALSSGSGSFWENPISFVGKNITVVTINYRLGALGFLAHPALDNPAAQKTGNYGILDQIAALNWVKTNIAKFGGDPDNVTIFGQSAGGLSVLVHLVSPLSVGLYHKAIIESGALYSKPPLLADAETQGTTFANDLGCNSGTSAQIAACLRALSVSSILTYVSSHPTTLNQSTALLRIDDVVIPKDLNTPTSGQLAGQYLRQLLVDGRFNNVPVINGSNHDEQRFHINGDSKLGTGGTCNFVSNLVPDTQGNSFTGAVTYMAALNNHGFSSNSSAIEAAYPSGVTGKSTNNAYAHAMTDTNFACRAFRVNKWIASHGGANDGTTFGYEFNDPKAPPYLFPNFTLHDGTTFDYGAYHGAELPYLWPMPANNACGTSIPALTVTQKQLAAKMVLYWTTFARTGNPNPTSGTLPPNWPQFTAAGSMMKFAGGTPTVMSTASFDSDHQCSTFWDVH